MPLYYETMDLATRDLAPAHLLVKIESFSSLDKCGVDEYETKEFDAGNYKWRLRINLKGHDDSYLGEYVSVYLAISSTQSFPQDWEVNVVFSICIFNHISGKYLFSPGKTIRFFSFKRECGIPKFILKEDLTSPSKGYMVEDSCVFGAEVFVVDSRSVATERLSLKNEKLQTYNHTFRVPNFSWLKHTWYSKKFTAGGYNWKLRIDPNVLGCYLSIYLVYIPGWKNLNTRVKVLYSICVKNQVDAKKNRICTSTQWFSASSIYGGWSSFISMAQLRNVIGGFIINDACVFETQISLQAVAMSK